MKFWKFFFLLVFSLTLIIFLKKIDQYIFQEKYVKILVLSFLILFSILGFLFYEKNKKILNIIFINFFLILYSLNFLTGFHFILNSPDYLKKKKIEKLNLKYDDRSQLEYIKDSPYLIYPMITPREVMQNNNELILSNITNSKYVQCNEFGKWKEIETDKYGFNNKNVKSKYNILIAGDSFAHGFCVDKSKEVHEILISMNIDTYSIGIAANGPMISLASMIEISNKIEFDKVYWLIFRNDFFDLNWESSNNYLKNYLKEDFLGFNYFDNIEDKNNIQKKFISQNKNKRKNFSYQESFFELKFINDYIKKIFFKKKQVKINEDLISKIFKIFDQKFINKDKVIIYLPNYKCFNDEYLLCDKEFQILEKMSANLNIELLNFMNVIDSSSFKDIFALGLNRLHYSELGYNKLANLIYSQAVN